MCFPSLVTFAGTSSPCSSLSSGSLFQATLDLPFHCFGDCATFVPGLLCALAQVFPLGLSQQWALTAGCSPCSGAGDVPCASAGSWELSPAAQEVLAALELTWGCRRARIISGFIPSIHHLAAVPVSQGLLHSPSERCFLNVLVIIHCFPASVSCCWPLSDCFLAQHQEMQLEGPAWAVYMVL